MILNVANNKPSVSYSAPLFTYSGATPLIKYDPNNEDNWEMTFEAYCKIKFQRINPKIDVFVVGGGNAGGNGRGNLAEAAGGNGGKGGACVTEMNVSVQTGTTYEIKVGGSGQPSSAFNVTAANGGGSAGGDGALHSTLSQARTNATAATAGTVAFGSGSTLFWNGYKYGPGGGGSAYSTLGGNVATASAGAQGNANGGGNGGSNGPGKKAVANSGGGGGGGASYHTNTGSAATDSNYSGGAGGSGIVIIRNHRA